MDNSTTRIKKANPYTGWLYIMLYFLVFDFQPICSWLISVSSSPLTVTRPPFNSTVPFASNDDLGVSILIVPPFTIIFLLSNKIMSRIIRDMLNLLSLSFVYLQTDYILEFDVPSEYVKGASYGVVHPAPAHLVYKLHIFKG